MLSAPHSAAGFPGPVPRSNVGPPGGETSFARIGVTGNHQKDTVARIVFGNHLIATST